MQAFDQEVAEELNEVRTSPQTYMNKILQYTKYFKGNVLHLPGSNVGIRTEEGAAAYEEAADFLSKRKGINALKLNYPLCMIAKEFLEEVQKTDVNSVNQIDLEKIMAKYGSFTGSFSRAIDFGGTKPELVISNLLVGDGDPNRGQRGSMFNENLNLIGVASGHHTQFGMCTVILTCTQFTSLNPEHDRIVFQEKKVSLHNQPTKLKSKAPGGIGHQAHAEHHGMSSGGDPDCPEGVKKVVRTENEVVEGGKRKKVIKTVKYMEDGSVQTEIEKETIG
jgi:hypothetical protein